MQLAEGLPPDHDFGANGILRTAGAVLIAVAIFRDGLLTDPSAASDSPRALIGSLAFGALFITAEVAQNFLSAEFGLLMGGAIAGALLLAARPIERALERRAEPPGAHPAHASQEEAYRKALRLALRDRQLTRAEELELLDVAEGLGIPGRRAHELLVEVELELARGQVQR